MFHLETKFLNCEFVAFGLLLDNTKFSRTLCFHVCMRLCGFHAVMWQASLLRHPDLNEEVVRGTVECKKH